MKKAFTVVKYALLLAVSGLLMVYALRGQDLSRVGLYLRKANYFWMGLTLAVSMLGYLSRAYRWKMQLDTLGGKPAYWPVYHALMVGYLANLVVPRLGEVARCSVLRRTSGVPVEASLGTVIAERVVDVLMLGLLLGATLLLSFQKFWGLVAGKMLGGGTSYAVLTRNRTPLLAAAVIGGLVLAAAAWAVWRNAARIRQLVFFDKLTRFAKGLLAGLLSIWRLENKGLFLLHTGFIWMGYYLMAYLAFFAFPETRHLTMGAGLAVLAFGTVGMAAPVSGGIGTYHVLVQSALLAYGVSAEAAIAYALAAHGSQTLLVVLMGGSSFAASLLKPGPDAGAHGRAEPSR